MTKPQTTLEQLDELDRIGRARPSVESIKVFERELGAACRELLHDARLCHQQAAVLELVRPLLLDCAAFIGVFSTSKAHDLIRRIGERLALLDEEQP